MSERNYADTIAKLLAKAESTTHPEEAEIFWQKAQELMAKYAIDEAMLEAARGFRQDDPVTEEEFVVVGIYRFALQYLAITVMRNNDLEVYQKTGKLWRRLDGKVFKETVVLVGFGYKSDIDRARALYTSLLLQATRAENAWWKENEYLYRHEKRGGHYARRQFLTSYAGGVSEKLAAASRKAQAEAAEEHGTDSVALVLQSKEMKLKSEFKAAHPNLKPSRSRYQGGSVFA